MTTPSFITLSDVSHSYLSHPVFEKVCLTLHPGQIALLTGPNGAGKTTLIKVLTGLLMPSQGRVDRSGAVSCYQTQGGFYWDLTLQENLDFFCQFFSIGSREADILVDQFSLTSLLHKTPRILSRGQRIRASLLFTFLKKADFYFLDEPFDGLDEAAIKQLLDVLADFKKKQVSILIVTHQPQLLDQATDRRFVLEQKQLIEA